MFTLIFLALFFVVYVGLGLLLIRSLVGGMLQNGHRGDFRPAEVSSEAPEELSVGSGD